jgi:hypothetical protein
LIVIGFVFLLHSLGIVTGSSWDIIWPCLIILFGLSIVCRGGSSCYKWLNADIDRKSKSSKEK